MTLIRNLLGTTPVSGAVDPEAAVSFDGTNDYLSRSSDLTGNADGKTFTFSAWVYKPTGTDAYRLITFDSSRFYIAISSDTSTGLHVDIVSHNGSSYVLYATTQTKRIANNTWHHILISIDMANQSNSKVYWDDEDGGFNPSQFNNLDIPFSSSTTFVRVLTDPWLTYKGKGIIAHVFLDHTYRDLSVEANRRLFIDSDGKPASGQADLSPILYLPMTDAATAGSNSGTGGDFTVNGVLDTASRAPNQFNCSASKFDSPSWSSGNDYLSKSSISGLTDGKKFTLSFVTRKDSNGNRQLLHFGNSNTIKFAIFHGYGSNTIYIRVYDTSSNIALNITGLPMIDGKIVHYTISVDMADTSKRFVYMNGESYAATYSTYTVNATLDFTWNQYQIGSGDDGSTQYWWDGSIGEFYFDTVYTDLSTDNPFWNSDTNRPKPVRQVISETGTTPLIALPLRGDDAGNNLGSGGDFTVNSGPFTGARGGSEFWARSANFDGTSGKLTNTALSGLSTGTKFTLIFRYQDFTYSDTAVQFFVGGGGGVGGGVFSRVVVGASSIGYKAGDGSADHIEFSQAAQTTKGTVMISVDNSASKVDVVVDGTYANKSSSIIVAGGNVTDSTENDSVIGARTTAGFLYTNGSLCGLYMDDSYIDLSQESNRNKFVDQLGYLKDLTPAIDAGDIAEPLIYMKFDDTSALGTNSGTGGDFTVNGTVTAGPDATP